MSGRLVTISLPFSNQKHILPASWCVFTNVSVATFVAGLWAGKASLLYAIGAQFVVFSCASFHVAALMDPTCFSRMRRRRGYSFAYFHFGNIILHVIPALYTLHAPPTTHRVWACMILACLLHEAWAMIVTGGTFNLDDVYVPMSHSSGAVWHVLTLVGFVSQAAFTWWVGHQ